MCGRRIYGYWGIEHVVIKGNNGMKIFNDDEDCRYFLNLFNSKIPESTSLISYVLMNNHVHLILKEKSPEKISSLMMSVCGPYANWFNKKYGRKNSLFRQRFYNESIEEERHLLNAIRYVHNNPVKAGIISHPKSYKWSSYNEYDGETKFIDKTVFLKYFDKNDYLFDESQIPNYKDKHESYYNSFEYAKFCYENCLKKNNVIDNSYFDSKERNKIIVDLYYNKKISYDYISKLFGLKKETVRKIIKP